MTDQQLTDEVFAIVREVLQLDEDTPISLDTTPDDVAEWDSLGWLNIVNAIEKRFLFEVPLEKMADFKSIADIRDIVSMQHGGSLNG